MMMQVTFSTIILLAVLKISEGNTITIGKDAELKCKEWDKSCTKGYVCVIQHLQWPMNMSFPLCMAESEISGMLIQVKLRVCQKPPQPGNCGARWVRWYFNTHIQKCSWFYYQGCRGNENNFKSKEECETECMSNQQTNIIQKPPSFGPVVVTQPLKSPDYSNYIDRTYSLVRSHRVSGVDRDVRRKRRLEKRRQKRLRKLMRKRRKSMRSKKRRREGKVNKKGSKKKDKKRKKRNKKKNKKKKRGRRGKKNKSKKSKGEKSTITFIPGDEITDTTDLVKKLVSKESSTAKQEQEDSNKKS